MVREIISHCKSCDTCARCNTSGQKRAPLQTRHILSEPFEAIACDLIGPFQKGRHGYRYVLTSVCLATRWLTAIPLKNIRAGTVAQGLIETFTQTAVPLQLLPDKGSQFTGKLFKNVVKFLNIEHLATTPYHPQCNGAVERLNGTVKQALTKQLSIGVNWVDALPLVMHHLRQCDHVSLGMSPHMLVYGREGRTLLDLLYAGWTETDHQLLNLCEYASKLADTLNCVREIAADKSSEPQQDRKKYFMTETHPTEF